MWHSVRDEWPSFVSKREGRTSYMYLDTLKWVTFGVGRKIDDDGTIADYGLTRPWRDRTGALVLESAIRKEFAMIKSHTELAPQGGFAFRDVATLHLAEPDIDEALWETTDAFWNRLAAQLPDLEEWPADAQIALLDMAYNLGPNFLGSGWPNFTAAAKEADFGACAMHCQTAKHSRRDQDHTSLFMNAAAVDYAELNRAKLWAIGVTPIVDTWKPPGIALTRIQLAEVKAAVPNLFCPDAWYVQSMLKDAGTYTSTHDGLWGPYSKAAYALWAKKHAHPTAPDLTGLRALSQSTLKMPVA